MFADDEDEVGHLHVILTPPNEKQQVVTVPITTCHKGMDTMLTLDMGDHPRIRHRSVLAYEYARIRTIPQIESLLRSYDATQQQPMQEEILKKCRNAVLESDCTVNEVRIFLAESKS
jgi:hypothetical protein